MKLTFEEKVNAVENLAEVIRAIQFHQYKLTELRKKKEQYKNFISKNKDYFNKQVK